MANKDKDNKKGGIDEATGTEFVGHEWDGIQELNTPLPRWWLWTLYATVIWGIIYMILYPAWPLLSQGTEGVLHWTSRGQFAEEMQVADEGKAAVREQIAITPIEQIPENDALMQQAIAGGAAAFKVNCVQCHGSGAAGSQELGYPNLADDDWLWGGDLKAIEYTLVHGIRQPDDLETRASAMPAFAGALDQAQINALVDYVLSLSGRAASNPVGKQLYDDNCVTCHGPSGEGDRAQGAPRLDDAIWLRGSSPAQIAQQILNPRMGVMPKWEGRLDPVTIKMLAIYVYSLGGGEELAKVVEHPAVEINEQP